MKWILYLLLFVTSAWNYPEGSVIANDKKERGHIWTFQNTTTMSLSSLDACAVVGNNLINSITAVDTMTVRAWCFCDDAKQCPNEDQAVAQAANAINADIAKQPEQIRAHLKTFSVPERALPTEKQDYTILRLFPPAKKDEHPPRGVLRIQ